MIGFIGLGIMGESMSENIVKKSSEKVMVYDINVSKIEELESVGAIGAKSISEIADKCDKIFIMVPTSKHVTSVIEQLISSLKEDTIVVDMSTIEPSVSKALAEKIKKVKNCDMIDAPVVKSKAAAIAGDLGIYVGGSLESYEKVKSILAFMGSNIIRMGDNGAGLVMKICHNMLVAQIQNGVNEMLTLAEINGLDFDDTVKAISYGGGQNFYLDGKNQSIKNGDFSPKFSVQNMNKDINIAVSLAKELGLKLEGAEVAKNVYQEAVDRNLNGEDFSATIKVVKEITKR